MPEINSLLKAIHARLHSDSYLYKQLIIIRVLGCVSNSTNFEITKRDTSSKYLGEEGVMT